MTLRASSLLLSLFALKTSEEVISSRSLRCLIGVVLSCKTMDGEEVGQS